MSDLLDLVLVTGAGGFIGGNLAADLRARGHKRIRAVDVKPFDEWCESFDDVENLSLDLNLKENWFVSTTERVTPLGALEPHTALRTGLEKTYRWIYDQYLAREKGETGVVREATPVAR